MEDVHDGLREKILKHKKEINKAISIVSISLMIACVAYSSYRATNFSMQLSEQEAQNAAAISALNRIMGKYNHLLKDPGSAELLQFLKTDQTDKYLYSEQFNCINFSAVLVANAMAIGMRCGLVQMWFEYWGGGHVMVAFNVAGLGTIFVEPQSDAVMLPLEKGDRYCNKTIDSIGVCWFA